MSANVSKASPVFAVQQIFQVIEGRVRNKQPSAQKRVLRIGIADEHREEDGTTTTNIHHSPHAARDLSRILFPLVVRIAGANVMIAVGADMIRRRLFKVIRTLADADVVRDAIHVGGTAAAAGVAVQEQHGAVGLVCSRRRRARATVAAAAVAAAGATLVFGELGESRPLLLLYGRVATLRFDVEFVHFATLGEEGFVSFLEKFDDVCC